MNIKPIDTYSTVDAWDLENMKWHLNNCALFTLNNGILELVQSEAVIV